MNWRALVMAVLEALEAGDQAHAVELMLDALEDRPRPVGVLCSDCGRRFDWPGLRDAHQVYCTARKWAA